MQANVPVVVAGAVAIAIGIGIVALSNFIATSLCSLFSRNEKRLRLFTVSVVSLGIIATLVGVVILVFGWWSPTTAIPTASESGVYIALAPGESSTIQTNVSFDPEPWPWHASDAMLSTVSQIIPVLLIAVGGLAVAARHRTAIARRWFWLVTVAALILVGGEALVLYQMGLAVGNRWPMGWIFLFVFLLPTLFTLALLRLALWPEKGTVASRDALTAQVSAIRPFRFGHYRRRAKGIRARRESKRRTDDE